MRITNGEEIAGQQSFYSTHLGKVTHRKIIGTLVALSLDLCFDGPQYQNGLSLNLCDSSDCSGPDCDWISICKSRKVTLCYMSWKAF